MWAEQPGAAAPANDASTLGRPVKVRIEGLGARLRKNVEAALSIRGMGSERLSEGEVRHLHERAAHEIGLALQPMGHYQPLVESVLREEPKRWMAVYTVDPGPGTRLLSVSVRLSGEGRADPQLLTLVTAFPLQAGKQLDHAAYERGKAALAQAAAARGYLDARFDPQRIEVDRGANAARIELELVTGPRYRFGEVRIEQDVIEPRILALLVPFAPGDEFDGTKLLDLQLALSRLAYFRRVETQIRRDLAQDRVVPVEVTVTAAPRLRFDVGAGYGSDTGLRGRLGVELRRINRRGHRAQVGTRLSAIETQVSGQYLIPWGSRVTSLLTFSTAYLDFDDGVSQRQTSSLGAAYSRPRMGWREATGLSVRRESYSVGVDEGVSTLFLPELSWNRAALNRRSRGWTGANSTLSFRLGFDPRRRDVAFYQARANLQTAKNAVANTRVLLRLDAGTTLTDRFRSLPPSFRFFAGGSQSVRGYQYNVLGSFDRLGNVIGGRHLVVGSVEFELQLVRGWGVAAFIDAGTAFDDAPAMIPVGIGVGPRWFSPVGPVRIDVAWAVRESGSPYRLHLSVGGAS